MSQKPNPNANPKASPKKIAPPKGTRDLYPEDLLRQQYITNAWRDAAIRCGFDEIAGPTFETTELYAVKSGEGILNELFQAFSGKGGQETLDKLVEQGQADFALRPEFTPTLARMYAARAKELPKPCKWFTAGPYFRAERPQRGRLREFLQWNVDAIGLPADDNNAENRAMMDREVMACLIQLLEDLGLTYSDCKINLNDRNRVTQMLLGFGLSLDQTESALAVLDQAGKRPPESLVEQAHALGIRISEFDQYLLTPERTKLSISDADGATLVSREIGRKELTEDQIPVTRELANLRLRGWYQVDPSIVRGLAYYTGTVFEAIADGERAVAGGGRYDNLIELFGGPPTPACGFGMGDVVLGNLLDDKGLMPTGAELMDAVARPQASIRPVAFVVPNGDDDNEALVHTLVANLRRGTECDDWKARDDRKPWDRDRYSVEPMHARISYKSTRNIKKLRSDAEKQHARFFVEIHADNKVELTNMDTREAITSDTHGSFSVDPAAPNYVGSAIALRV